MPPCEPSDASVPSVPSVAGTRLDAEQRLSGIDTDFPRMKAGLVGAQFWSAYVPASLVKAGGATYALTQIDLIHRMIAHSPRSGSPPDAQVTKIIGGNLLRVMRPVEAVAARLQRERPPAVARIEVLDRGATR